VSQSDFVSRGQALVAAGQFQEAVKVCRLGLLGRPTTVEGRVVLGQALLALKRYDEVLAEMRVALELDHTAITAHNLKAEALLRKGDSHAAIEALHEARRLAPGDARTMQLLGEAEHGPGKVPQASHPSANFVGSGDTKHYPNHPGGGAAFDANEASEGFTKPTSLSAPGSIKRTSERRAAAAPSHDPTPPPAVLAVGDKSGTVEVDPELEGVEMDDDLDFDDLAAPPVAKKGAKSKPMAAAPAKTASKPNPVKEGLTLRGPGGAGAARAAAGAKLPRPKREDNEALFDSPKDKRTPTTELAPDDDSDILEIDETRIPPVKRPSASAVRAAVKMPSGPLDIGTGQEQPLRGKPASVPPLAQTLAAQPHVVQPRAPIAAALPTVAAMPPPASNAQVMNAQRATMAMPAPVPLNHAQQQSAAVVDGLFGNEQAVNWGAPDPRAVAAANEPTAKPQQVDPAVQALLAQQQAEAAAAAAAAEEPVKGKVAKTGMRKTRSRLQIAMWIVLGVVVIGGGVFAGFQIRAMRLQKQISAARDRAYDLAKADTWSGWIAARDGLANIVQVSGTPENRAALARSRATLAYEFGENVAEAKPAIDALAGKGGVDTQIAAAYVSLATSNVAQAKLDADAAIAAAPGDAGALYVSSQATLLAGDAKTAAKLGKDAWDKEPRPLYGVGLAKAYAASYAWDDAIGALTRVFAGNPDHPAAVIERAIVLADAGRIAPGVPLGNEVRGQLEKVVAEGKRPIAEQAHGVAPAQVAFGNLALARVDFARNDIANARSDVNAAGAVGLDDQRFAEQVVETLYLIGELGHAQNLATDALKQWPGSRRVRISLALIALAQGRAADALDVLSKQSDLGKVPLGLAVLGQAKLANGDVDGARAAFEDALKTMPHLEPALIGRAWLDLANGDIDEAARRISPIYNEKGSTPALTTVYAAVLRRSTDPVQRDKARALLEKLVAGAPGPDMARAQLELARVYHDLGDFQAARKAYSTAMTTGNFDARLESGLLSIEDRDPNGGRETLDALLKEAGEHPPPILVLETARARMLAGDHAGAAQLLETAEKLPGVQKWKLQRERGRLFLRRGDFAAAVTALGSALEGCGDDAETFLLAADAATSDDKSGLGDKVKKLLDRLKGTAEQKIVTGKFLLATGKDAEAETAYRTAREQLKSDKAAARRIAQANYGLAVVAYNRQDDPNALAALNLVINDDPSIYDAYLFKADILRDVKQAFDQAQIAVHYNADYPRAWHVLGKLAAKKGDRATLADAITKLGALAPNSEELKELQRLRR
jgi:tetratricopeptide (TPR) repeat protein